MWSPDSEINSIGMTIRHSISASSGELRFCSIFFFLFKKLSSVCSKPAVLV